MFTSGFSGNSKFLIKFIDRQQMFNSGFTVREREKEKEHILDDIFNTKILPPLFIPNQHFFRLHNIKLPRPQKPKKTNKQTAQPILAPKPKYLRKNQVLPQKCSIIHSLRYKRSLIYQFLFEFIQRMLLWHTQIPQSPR